MTVLLILIIIIASIYIIKSENIKAAKKKTSKKSSHTININMINHKASNIIITTEKYQEKSQYMNQIRTSKIHKQT